MQQEAVTHEFNAVATLTYAPEHVGPLGRPQWRADADKMLQDLRNTARRKWGQSVRYDLISEYSPELFRPHLHAILFGVWPLDFYFWKQSRAGLPMYRSAEFEKCWPWGTVLFQDFSPGSAAYCANHQAFKLNGRSLEEWLTVRDDGGTVLGQRAPEFHLVSKRPGLGAEFFERWGRQVIELQHTVVGDSKVGPPRYFVRLAERDPALADLVAELKASRKAAAIAQGADCTPERLAVRLEVAKAKQRQGLGRGAFDK